jgi:hypothetical protein
MRDKMCYCKTCYCKTLMALIQNNEPVLYYTRLPHDAQMPRCPKSSRSEIDPDRNLWRPALAAGRIAICESIACHCLCGTDIGEVKG